MMFPNFDDVKKDLKDIALALKMIANDLREVKEEMQSKWRNEQ